jgi:Phage integrase family
MLSDPYFQHQLRSEKTHIMSTICPIGIQNDSEFPRVSSNDNSCPRCAGDVLVHLTTEKFYANICSVLNLYAKFAGATTSSLAMSLDLILERQRGFRSYLEQRNYADSTICNHNRWVYEFLNHAKAFGWIPDGYMSPEWGAVAARIDGSLEVVRHFARRTHPPAELTRPDVDCWVDQQVISGERSFDAANQMANKFIHTMLVLGHTQVDPLRAVRLDTYGIPLAQFPTPLKEEVEALLALRQSDSGDEGIAELLDELDDLDLNDYRDRSEGDESRPPHSQIRAISALLLEQAICRLYGYVHGTKGKNIVSLQMLFNPRVLKNYREWLRTTRKVSEAGLRGSLIPILSAMLQSKTFDPKSLRWIEEFRRQLGTTPSQDEIRMKKAHKQLEYAEVAAIPNKLSKERYRLAHKKVNSSTRRGGLVSRLTLFRLARLSMYDLVIRWYLFLPWRQRNMREMRVDGSEQNLVKMPIPDGFEIDRPKWVMDEEKEAEVKKNPKPEFWLYRFASKENKTGKLIYCVLPKPLVEPLEDYLHKWRPILLKKRSTQTLFLDCRGGRMTAKSFGSMICELALRYGGKRMNPHIFRDVFAFAYLKKRPKDFIQLSIMLWHSKITTTMEYYGGKFNASCGTAAVETWFEEMNLS